MPVGLGHWALGPDQIFTPLSFPEVWLWVTPTISSSITTVSGQVEGWADQTSAHRNLSGDPNTGGGGYIETGVSINGVAALNFSGTSGGTMTTGGVNPGILCFGSLEYFTVFCVIQPEVGINPHDPYSRIIDTEFSAGFTLCINSAGTHYKLIVADSSSPYGTVEGGTPTVGTPVLLTGIYSNGNATLQVNGSTVATGTFTNPSGNSTIGPTICALSGSSGEGQPGYFGDICICVGAGSTVANPQPTAALSGTTLTAANNYFLNKYGLT
jgi:hypothetical protein